MSVMEHRGYERHLSYVKKLTVRIGGADGAILTFHDRRAWELLCSGEAGVAPLDCAAPERHGGLYAGRHGRYVLRSLIEIIDREDVE
jgi:hypothetical protein